MLGDILPLANNLWLVAGDMPEDNFKQPDIANALVYRAGDRLYLLDSGAGSTIRKSIMQVLQEVGPVQSFTLLNSHAHADHTANNDLIHLVQARETHHYLSEAGLALLDPLPHFTDLFYGLSAYYDLMTGYQAHRVLARLMGVVRDLLAVFVGERRALEMLIPVILRKFQPIRASRETIHTYKSLPRQPLVIGGVPWTGWVLGENDVWILEARGHTPDEVLFYLPGHQVLHTADLTFALFPTFPDFGRSRHSRDVEQMSGHGSCRCRAPVDRRPPSPGLPGPARSSRLLGDAAHRAGAFSSGADADPGRARWADGGSDLCVRPTVPRRPGGAALSVTGVSPHADRLAECHHCVSAPDGI